MNEGNPEEPQTPSPVGKDDANAATQIPHPDASAAETPTQVAPAQASDRGAALAYSETVEDEVASSRRPWPSVIRWAAILLAITAVTATGIVMMGVNDKPPSQAHTPMAASSPVLDGAYRVEYDNAKQTFNAAPDPTPATDNIRWWAFRSRCTSTGCAATGTQLDTNNHQTASAPTDTAAFRFTDGHWQRMPEQFQQQHPACLAADGKSVVAGADTGTVTWKLEPQPDGTLRGTATQTVLTNVCGTQGEVYQEPIVLTRTGDAPTGVAVADPTTIIASQTPAPPNPVLGGPVLDGTFRIDYSADQTINGKPMIADAPATEWWAFRSQCADTDCVATGFKLADTNHQAAAGVAVVLHYADGHWKSAPHLQPPTKCESGGDSADISVITLSMDPQPDGTLRGVQTINILTGECGLQGTVALSPTIATRMGDAPTNITPPDPTLFMGRS